MKKAFTMIELIFVIVIIGILAAAAIPKLSATRDDAKISEMAYNAKTLLGDFESFYVSQGNSIWKQETIKHLTNVSIKTDCNTIASKTTQISPNTFVLCHENTICLSFNTTDEGNLTIMDGTGTSDAICEAIKNVVSFSNKSYKLGGNTINRN